MDAGPILATERVELNGHETSSELLPRLFAQGTTLLLGLLPRLFAGSCPETPQATEGVSQAPKLDREDGHVRFATLSARQVHNKCRAFSDWPGVFADFQVDDLPPFRLKINRTVVLREAPTRGMSLSLPLEEQQLQREKNANRTVAFLPLSKALIANNCNSDSSQPNGCKNSNTDDRSDNIAGQDSSLNNSRQQEWCMQLTYGDGSVLGILEVQPVNKKVMRVKDFLNGFRGKQIAFRFCE